MKYFLLFRTFEQLALALKTEFALIFFKPGGGAADPPPRTPLVATIHGNFTSKHQTETFKFGRMQHLKFIA